MQTEIRETFWDTCSAAVAPIAFDRILALLFGVKAFELALQKKFGRMVAFKNNSITSVTLEEATRESNVVKRNSEIVKAAKG